MSLYNSLLICLQSSFKYISLQRVQLGSVFWVVDMTALLPASMRSRQGWILFQKNIIYPHFKPFSCLNMTQNFSKFKTTAFVKFLIIFDQDHYFFDDLATNLPLLCYSEQYITPCIKVELNKMHVQTKITMTIDCCRTVTRVADPVVDLK